jgi:preprotein translocase subunit YajC
MEKGTIIMMIIILGGVFGGFIYTINLAMRKEKKKTKSQEE